MTTNDTGVQLELARRFYEAFDSRDPAQMDALVAPDAIDHDGGGATALDSMRGLVAGLAAGFAEYKHQIQIVEPIGDDRVFVRWRMEGRHTGDMLGVPASGRSVWLHGHDLMRVHDGKIVEIWHIEQLLQLAGQMQG